MQDLLKEVKNLVTQPFLSLLPSAEGDKTHELNKMMVKTNIEMVQAEVEKKRHEAERLKVELASRETDLADRRDKLATTKEIRFKQELTKEERQLLKEQKDLATQTWENEKEEAKLANQRTKVAHDSELSNIRLQAEHERAKVDVEHESDVKARQQSLTIQKGAMRINEQEQETMEDLAIREANLRARQGTETIRKRMKQTADIKKIRLTKEIILYQNKIAQLELEKQLTDKLLNQELNLVEFTWESQETESVEK